MYYGPQQSFFETKTIYKEEFCGLKIIQPLCPSYLILHS